MRVLEESRRVAIDVFGLVDRIESMKPRIRSRSIQLAPM